MLVRTARTSEFESESQSESEIADTRRVAPPRDRGIRIRVLSILRSDRLRESERSPNRVGRRVPQIESRRRTLPVIARRGSAASGTCLVARWRSSDLTNLNLLYSYTLASSIPPVLCSLSLSLSSCPEAPEPPISC